jgi:copper chaperone NosL
MEAAAMHRRSLLLAGLCLSIAACKKQTAEIVPPAPRPISAAATAEFCSMGLLEHPGPKAQIFVRDRPDPYWFATVRDAIAFMRLPEMPKDIAVIWVSDMAHAHDWQQPDVWVDASQAVFVIGSRRRSGMETDEAVPFSDADAARMYAETEGGRVVRLSEIPSSYIFPEGTRS